MSTFGNPRPWEATATSAAGSLGPTGLPPLPQVDLRESAELKAWLERLQAQECSIGVRNRYLLAALGVGLVVLAAAVWSVYYATVGAYAVLDAPTIKQHPASQGRLELTFRVLRPGKVYFRRQSGGMVTDRIDNFRTPGEVRRVWAWGYEPGKPIELTLWYRRGLARVCHAEQFPTFARADLVVLIDSTGSMERSIDELKAKCRTFSERLRAQALAHRLALIGFGDRAEAQWLDRHEWTADAAQFQQAVANLKRFDGGDLPESVLDALEEALTLPFDDQAIRQFYLVTDAPYHEPSRSGATAEDLAARLAAARVVLHVFSRPALEPAYRKLLGDVGRFQEIESFGRLLQECRVLED